MVENPKILVNSSVAMTSHLNTYILMVENNVRKKCQFRELYFRFIIIWKKYKHKLSLVKSMFNILDK